MNEEFPDYFNLFSRKNASAGVKTVRHSGRRLLSGDDRIMGAKTGYTRASGYSGVTLSQEGSKKIVTVVFGGRSTTTRNAQMRKLRDLGFKKASSKIYIEPKPSEYSSICGIINCLLLDNRLSNYLYI